MLLPNTLVSYLNVGILLVVEWLELRLVVDEVRDLKKS